jgi:hypothetical protein
MVIILTVLSIGVSVLVVTIYEYIALNHGRESQESLDNSRPRTIAVAVLMAVGAAAVFYRLLFYHRLQQTSALFIGIPVVLAIATVFVPSRSATGVALKSVTIGLLISLLFLGEGMLCVLMSAPLFYLVALLIGWAVSEVRTPTDRGWLSSWIALMSVIPMSLEGVTPMTTVPRHVTVHEARIVNASAASIDAAIQQQPRFERALPRFLSMGFPRPTSTRIQGDRWVIRMRGGEMRLNGMEPRAGDLVLVRDGRGGNFISWRAVSDDSHMTHFLNWQTSRVEWTPIDARTTRVTWTLQYRRGLDPAWYFGPMERYAMTLAAGYLIDTVATP